MQSDSADITTEALLRAVADSQRRTLLRYFRDADTDAMTVDELARALANAGDRGIDRPLDEFRITLQHIHLPKLSELGVVRFDAPTSTVRYVGDDRVEAVLQFIATELE